MNTYTPASTSLTGKTLRLGIGFLAVACLGNFFSAPAAFADTYRVVNGETAVESDEYYAANAVADKDALTVTGNSNYTGNNITLFSDEDWYSGVYINGKSGQNPAVILNGGQIATTGYNSHGAYIGLGALTITGASISTGGDESTGVRADGGALTVNGGSITTTGYNALGAGAKGGTIMLNNVNVSVDNTALMSHAVLAESTGKIVIAGTTTIYAAERSSGLTYDAVARAGGVVEFQNNNEAYLRLYATTGGMIKMTGASSAANAHVNLENGGIFDISENTGDITIRSMFAQGGSTIKLGTTKLILDGNLTAPGATSDSIQTSGTVTVQVTLDAAKSGGIEVVNGFKGDILNFELTLGADYDPVSQGIGTFLKLDAPSISAINCQINGKTVADGDTITISGVDFKISTDEFGNFGYAAIPEPAAYSIAGGAAALFAALAMRRRRLR